MESGRDAHAVVTQSEEDAALKGELEMLIERLKVEYSYFTTRGFLV
jgi:hypothetical protein